MMMTMMMMGIDDDDDDNRDDGDIQNGDENNISHLRKVMMTMEVLIGKKRHCKFLINGRCIELSLFTQCGELEKRKHWQLLKNLDNIAILHSFSSLPYQDLVSQIRAI